LSEFLPYLLILATLVVGSAFFSGSEVALFSLRRVDRETLRRSTTPNDTRVLRLLSQPRRLIAMLLLGNETVNVAISVVMAGLAPRLFGARSELELAMLTTAVTLPILLCLGEITPKTIAIKTSMGWARGAARPLWLWGILTAPLRVVIRAVVDTLVHAFGADPDKSLPPDLGEEEFKSLVDAGSAEGALDARERRLIHRVFEFGDKTVAQVMQPRSKIFALSYDLPMNRLTQEIAARGYSRIPIYQKSLDDVRGVLYAKDLVVHGTGRNPPRPLKELLHAPLFVPPRTKVSQLFRLFKQQRTHLAMVVDEYGKLSGLVSMDDLLGQLFGKLRDERELLKSREVKP
jgi:CBS domain containing-hemolysin-like protein